MARNGLIVARAIVGGAAIASTIGALVMFVLAFAAQPTSTPLLALPFWVGINLALTVPLASTAGLTWHGLASALGWRQAITYVLPGMVFGAALPVVLFLVSVGVDAFESILPAMLACYGSLLGGLTVSSLGAFAALTAMPHIERNRTASWSQGNPVASAIGPGSRLSAASRPRPG